MKTLIQTIYIILLSMSSLLSKDGENEDMQKSLDKSRDLMISEGYNLANFRKPEIWDKNDPKNPIKQWAKKNFNKEKLIELEGLEYFTVEYRSIKPQPGGVTLFILTKKDAKLVARSGRK